MSFGLATVIGGGGPDGRDEALGGTVGAEDVWTAEPVVRRVVAARVRDRTVVDDLVQDVLERLLRARKRIDGSLLVPYAVVTARNVVASYARRAGREELRSEVDGPVVADAAYDRVVADEDRLALLAALARLPVRERDWLVAHETAGVAVGDLESGSVSPATMRVRLARARAKLRVEYALVRAGFELPTERCRPTLLALAGGERARRSAAARHLLDCEICAAVSDEVVAPRRGLALVVPVIGWRWICHGIRSHPAVSAAGATATAAVVAGGIVAYSAASSPASHRADQPVAPTTTAVPVLTSLSVDGRPLVMTADRLRQARGQVVTARQALVLSVVTHDGFWVGSPPTQQVFVELVGPLRSLQVRAGEHVSFAAPLVPQVANYASEAGVTGAGGAAELNAEGVHLAVATSALTVQP